MHLDDWTGLHCFLCCLQRPDAMGIGSKSERRTVATIRRSNRAMTLIAPSLAHAFYNMCQTYA